MPALSDKNRLATVQATALLDSPTEESFDRLTRLVTDPVDLLRDVYGWGADSIDAPALFSTLQTLLSSRFEIPAIIQSEGQVLQLDAFGFFAEFDPIEDPSALTVHLRMPAGLTQADLIRSMVGRDLDAVRAAFAEARYREPEIRGAQPSTGAERVS